MFQGLVWPIIFALLASLAVSLTLTPLLAAKLFYAEGVHTVGIDRVIERAGVAKASLYSTFGSKEELVRAYLAGRAESRQRRISNPVVSP